jgi:hypothetical protein
MAHATSLGRTVAASGICDQWPQVAFRLTVSSTGDVLTITATASQRTGPGEAATARHGRKDHPFTVPADNVRPASAVRADSATPGRARRAAVGDGGDPDRFYRILGELSELQGGPRRLRDCSAGGCPRWGVYFFFEDGEVRRDGGGRVVRVGTHALTATSQATLWGRLRQHLGRRAGQNPGSGNHRASVFRRHVGATLIQRDELARELLDSWLDRHGPHEGWATQETEIEMAVSLNIGAMPVLWLNVPNRADRGYVECNSIALTSRLAAGLDPPSHGWLGHHAVPIEIRQSGLWNVQHVTQPCHPEFLASLERLVQNHT